MYAKLKAARIKAMKDKDSVAKALYSTFIGEIEKEAKNAMIEPNDELVSKIAKKFAKSINENIKMYTEKGVDTLNEHKELDIVSQYLPKQLSYDQTRDAVAQAIAKSGISSLKEQGKVMGSLKKEYGNSLDMKIASQIVRESLSA